MASKGVIQNRLSQPLGSKYLSATDHTEVNCTEFVAQEDTIITLLEGGDASVAATDVDYKSSMNLDGVTLKKGALIVSPAGEAFQNINISEGSALAYNSVVGGTKPSAAPSILDFNPYNVWDSEHVIIDGTETTFTDFNNVGTTYDLVNPTATNQPTYTVSDADFNNLPSLTFDGTSDYLINEVSDYRISDNSGMMVCVIKRGLDDISPILSFGAGSGTTRMSLRLTASGELQFVKLGGTSGTIINTTTETANNTQTYVLVIASTGSAYKMFIDSGSESFSGTDNGVWLSDYTSGILNNISIGASVSGTINYADAKVAMSGYFPYVDDATTLNLISILKTKYGI
jgi:hypothetical protein